MSEEDEIKKFKETHPWPDEDGIDSLYRFARIGEDNIEFLRGLLVNRKLYHALPNQFNDPFECKPHFNWPSQPQNVQKIRKHLIKVARERGCSRKEAEGLISKKFKKPGFIEEKIYGAIQRSLSEIRICCFTKQKENLLFWAHYADSHKGFCLEYDATLLPIKSAFKVTYNDEYPEVNYPWPQDARGLAPALIKSEVWCYEEEYRILYVPEANSKPEGDGQSLLLPENAIKSIYFGENIDPKNKEKILELINEGPFKPDVWQAQLSRSSFKLEFIRESSNTA
jgi:hypothetical protein